MMVCPTQEFTRPCRGSRGGLAVKTARQAGFTLVELMIGMAVGMVVLAAVTNVLVSSNNTNLDTLRMMHFNQEMRTIMGLIASDLRRAGYNGSAVSLIGQGSAGTTSPFQVSVPSANTILYGYDDSSNSATNNDGALNGTESYGIRLSGNVVQRSTDGGASWQSLSDSNNLTVTALTFTLNDQLVCQGTNPSAFNGMHMQSVQVIFTATSPKVTSLTRTLTETVRTRNNRYEYFAAGNCTPT